MNKLKKIKSIRFNLVNGKPSIGSWIQIPNSSTAEIMGQSGYEWIAVDMEHGTINHSQLPDIFRALELGGALPLVRIAEGNQKECKQVLDAGAGGIIIPMVDNSQQLEQIIQHCYWPPNGNRGVGFSRANLFGKNFNDYAILAQSPIIVAQIENIKAVNNLKDIVKVNGLDAIIIGPYDLTASMGITGQFDSDVYNKTLNTILSICKKNNMPFGYHIINPDLNELKQKIDEGYQFIPFSIDAVFLSISAELSF